MLIDFNQSQLDQFDAMAAKIQASPEHYIDFDSVSDFYKALWLNDFPTGTTWTVTGLDDGAEQFHAIIQYKTHFLTFSCTDHIEIYLGIEK